jgi:hypothetical protein
MEGWIGKPIEHAAFDRQEGRAAALLREAQDAFRRVAKITPVLPKRDGTQWSQKLP